MTFAEALVVLGIDARTDSRSGRRAYLRKVKEFKPERDPEGFQRVRSAWELVEPRLVDAPAEDRPAPRAPRPLTATIARPVDAAPAEALPDAPIPARPPESPGPTDDPPAASAEPLPWTHAHPDLSAFTFALHDLPLDGPRGPERGVPEPAPWEAPPPADTRRWTVEPLPEPPSVPEPAPVPGPAPVPPQDREPAPPALDGWTPPPPPPDPSLFLAEARANAEIDAGIALSCLTRALHLARAGARPEPDPRVALDVVLGLHRSGAAHEARQAWVAVRDWIDATGAGIRLSGALVGWLALVRELSDLPVRFPPAVRRRIAEAIADQDLGAAANDLLELYRSAPHVALDAADLLEVHAPNLHKLYGASLRDPVASAPPPPPKPEPEASGASWLSGSLLFYVALLVATIGLRVCVTDRPTVDYSTLPGAIPMYDFQRPPEPIVFPPLDLSAAQSDPIALIVLCTSLHPQGVCVPAREAYTAMKAEDCPGARAALARAADEAERYGVRSDSEFMDTRRQLGEITRLIDPTCPPEEPPSAP